MTQANTNHPVQLKNRVNLLQRFTGWLLRDNKLFDRICPQCRTMHSSMEHTVCVRCGSALDFIRIKDGRTMAISEGVFGIALSEKQKERDLQDIKARRGGLPIEYRFKMFDFGAPNMPPTIPALHVRCKKGSLIEVTSQNHQLLPKPYKGKNGWMVELMIQIFTKYGDKVEILAAPKVADATVPHRVNADGSPALIDFAKATKEQQLSEIERKMAELRAMMAMAGGAAPTQPAPKSEMGEQLKAELGVGAGAPDASEDEWDYGADYEDYSDDEAAAVAADTSTVNPFDIH